MTTMRDVARHAKVSVTTVSHVVNGTRFVESGTEERVRTAIEMLGYRPNLLARGLRRRQTGIIALLVPDNSNPFFADVARIIEDAGFVEGYSVILCNSDLSETKESAYIDMLLSRQVDGLILISSGNNPEQLQRILAAEVPVVVVDRELGDMLVDQVLVDNEQGGYQAGRYLVGLGHHRIGCIVGPSDVTPSARRIAGFRRSLEESGLTLMEDAIVRGDGRYEGGEDGARQLIDRDLGITAVFAYNDLMAIGAMGTFRRSGLSVPGDVSVIGFDDIQQTAEMVPSVTTIAQPVAEIGKVATQLLLNRIGRQDSKPSRVMLPTKLIKRESCRAIGQVKLGG